ncbi:hypothetical protein L2649_06855 [Thermoactinomyces vulgaris]|jgi:hypothetical protein|uniref:Uncharacterized protein n=1 Tax=Thermoactinomyces vulgaris TaxID=2026 RepID=A0ABS0QGS7_THEVU|nr:MULTISPECIES: hypothetical protein [Thermoactinomyces]MBA4550702.1 hypothetical protein [Thermoactinomyces vulgaris]MBA4596239.1 hypothetical protein [Thermoactinomyces vulgaris]MBH8588478.1 hypothetical protein [Thermoactinomyces vulgaris]MCF6134891.1 hypothetical protein [Thermoactinomyces vulgaris]QCV54988.1 hypothetical protein FA954_04830 [Thermoactinomyces vulgaris]
MKDDISTTELENQLGAVFHPSIKAYFNSYWFAELDGFIENDCIHWSRCCPGSNWTVLRIW